MASRHVAPKRSPDREGTRFKITKKKTSKRRKNQSSLFRIFVGVISALTTVYIVLLYEQHKHIDTTSAATQRPTPRPTPISPPVSEIQKPVVRYKPLPRRPEFGGNDRPRIIFAVPMPWPLKDDLAKDNLVATISTWGSHATKLVLVVSEQQIKRYPPETSLGERHSQIKDYLHPVDMKRPDGIAAGRHIWEKMWRGWKMVGDKFRHEAEWFVKTDLDTYIAVENMRAFLHNLDPDKPYYFGHTLFHDWQRHNLVFNSGTCYVLSRESLRRLAIRLDQIDKSRQFTYMCGDGEGAREDPHTAGCLRDVGVWASDSLDSEGRQRFLTFRPKDHLFAMKLEPGRERTWFWMYKDISKSLLDCCSNYPIAFHNFKTYPSIVYDPEAYYTLEYYLSSKPYEAILESIDPPRGGGQEFAVPKEVPFEIDEERNIKGVDPQRMLNSWLRKHPEAAACVNKTSSCVCKIPHDPIPHIGVGATLEGTGNEKPCVPGGTLRQGDKCAVKCKDGFETIGESSEQVYVSCPDGALLYPTEPLECKIKCDSGRMDELKKQVQASGDKVVEGKAGALVRCGSNRALFDGKKEGLLECTQPKDQSVSQKVGSNMQCGACMRWTISLSGSSYTHAQWKTVKFDGNANTKFEVAAVPMGSRYDPNKNCHVWHQETQLVLRAVGDPEPIVGLSCGNQLITIKDIKKSPRKCS